MKKLNSAKKEIIKEAGKSFHRSLKKGTKSKGTEDLSKQRLTNHGIPEKLMEELMNKSREFFELPEEEKKEFGDGDQGPFAPIRELAFEFTSKIKGVVRNLLEGIAESLGLESNSIIESTGFDSGAFQVFAVNFYPPCPQPHLAQGLPPHSDQGFMTLVMQNGIGGLQVKHDGKWVNVNPLPNSFVVVIGDQVEVLSNGRYESALHRAILNNTVTRMTLVVAHGPALDKEIGAAPEILEKEKPVFRRYKYQDYFHFQQKTRFADKSSLEEVRLRVDEQ
ncbi:hypothetical protein RJT34_01111 [Clitoria ternatea]|uniref:Fe2OG dioxygenase domain-containing protein n=1 Tax=Clitoria ternatea TaxID=43366 RepID=A0AAN9PYD5_CLITE